MDGDLSAIIQDSSNITTAIAALRPTILAFIFLAIPYLFVRFKYPNVITLLSNIFKENRWSRVIRLPQCPRN